MSDAVQQLVSRLYRAELAPTADELADFLWLVEETGLLVTTAAPQDAPLPSPQPDLEPEAPEEPEQPTAPVFPDIQRLSPPPLTPLPEPRHQPDHGLRLTTSAPRAYSGRAQRAFIRELRPLAEPIAAPALRIFDEAATVDRSADEEIWHVVTRADTERWLDLQLIIDQQPSLLLWQQHLNELRQLLEQPGLFRTVQVWSLEAQADEPVLRSITPAQGHLIRMGQAQTLCDSRQRQLFLLVSDCVGPLWHSGALNSFLQIWSRTNTAAVWQLLPQAHWQATALAKLPPIEMRAAKGPAGSVMLVSNSKYTWWPVGFVEVPERHTVVPVPVISSDVASLRQFIGLLRGEPRASVPGYAFGEPPPAPALTDESQLSPRERLGRFEAAASPTARKLAQYLAHVDIYLPVMRYVATVMEPPAQTAHCAEVFLSGLLTVRRQSEPSDVTAIHLDFIPGVRELLRPSVPLPEQRLLQLAIARHLALDFGVGRKVSFQSLIATPGRFSAETIRIDRTTCEFARLTIPMLRQMGAPYTALAEILEQKLRAFDQVEAPIAQSATAVAEPDGPSSLTTDEARQLLDWLLAQPFEQERPIPDLGEQPDAHAEPELVQPPEPVEAPRVALPKLRTLVRVSTALLHASQRSFTAYNPPARLPSGKEIREVWTQGVLIERRLADLAEALTALYDQGEGYSPSLGELYAEPVATFDQQLHLVESHFIEVRQLFQAARDRFERLAAPTAFFWRRQQSSALARDLARLQSQLDALAEAVAVAEQQGRLLHVLPLQAARLAHEARAHGVRVAAKHERLRRLGCYGASLDRDIKHLRQLQARIESLPEPLLSGDEQRILAELEPRTVSTAWALMQRARTAMDTLEQRAGRWLARHQGLAQAVKTLYDEFIALHKLVQGLPPTIDPAPLVTSYDQIFRRCRKLRGAVLSMNLDELSTLEQEASDLAAARARLDGETHEARGWLEQLVGVVASIRARLAATAAKMERYSAKSSLPIAWDAARASQTTSLREVNDLDPSDARRTPTLLAEQLKQARSLEARIVSHGQHIDTCCAARDYLVAHLDEQAFKRGAAWVATIEARAVHHSRYSPANWAPNLKVAALHADAQGLARRAAQIAAINPRSAVPESRVVALAAEARTLIGLFAAFDARSQQIEARFVALEQAERQARQSLEMVHPELRRLQGKNLALPPGDRTAAQALQRVNSLYQRGQELSRNLSQRPIAQVFELLRASRELVSDTESAVDALRVALVAGVTKSRDGVRRAIEYLNKAAKFPQDLELSQCRATLSWAEQSGVLAPRPSALAERVGELPRLAEVYERLAQAQAVAAALAERVRDALAEVEAARAQAQKALDNLDRINPWAWPPVQASSAQTRYLSERAEAQRRTLSSADTINEYCRIAESACHTYTSVVQIAQEQYDRATRQRQQLERIQSILEQIAWNLRRQAASINTPQLLAQRMIARADKVEQGLGEIKRRHTSRALSYEQALSELSALMDRARNPISAPGPGGNARAEITPEGNVHTY